MNEITRITSRDQLRAVARQLGVRPDWHEPDEQRVTAQIRGSDFDNAGFWGHRDDGATLSTFGEGRQELWVGLSQDGKPVAEVNLATLLAWAAEDSLRDQTRAMTAGWATVWAEAPAPRASIPGITCEEHRSEALTRLADFADSNDVTWDSSFLPALVHAVLALTAPSPRTGVAAPGLIAQGSARDITYAGPTGRELPGEHWNARILREQAETTVVLTPHTGMAAHDGLRPHSHEVRPDHIGVEQAAQPALPDPDWPGFAPDALPVSKPSWNELYKLASDMAGHAPVPGHTPDRHDSAALAGIAARARQLLGLDD